VQVTFVKQGSIDAHCRVSISAGGRPPAMAGVAFNGISLSVDSFLSDVFLVLSSFHPPR